MIRAVLAILLLLLSTLSAATETASPWVYPTLDTLTEQDNSLRLIPNEARLARGWGRVETNIPNYGYDPHAHWFRFSLSNASDHVVQKLIEVAYPQLDYVDVYFFRHDEISHSYFTGDRVPYSQRAIDHPNFLFPVTLAASETVDVLIRVQTNGSLQVPIRVWDYEAFFQNTWKVDQAHAMYYGILIVVIFINAFVFLALRERTYLLYVLSTFSYLLLLATLRGKTFQVLWPESPDLQNLSMLLTIPCAVLFSNLFARHFLEIDHRYPILDRLTAITTGLSALCVGAVFLLDYNTSIRLSVALAIPALFLLLVAGPVMWVKGSRPARFYTLAWALVTFGGMLMAMNRYGLIAPSPLTEYAFEIGSALEAILLTIAMAERLLRERDDKLEAQTDALHEHSERRATELRMMDQALHSPITGLPNQACFEILVNDAIRRRSDRRVTVAIIRLENYTAIQNTFGYANSEGLIRVYAKALNRLAETLPGIQVVEQKSDTAFFVASLEAYSFGLLIDLTDSVSIHDDLIAFLNSATEPLDFLGMRLETAPIVGAANYPADGLDAAGLIRGASVATDRARNDNEHMAFYDAAEDSYSAERLTFASDLKKAISNNTLTLHFQPIVSLGNQRVESLEALLRWPRQPGSMENTEALIVVAEQTGLIRPLTRWVLEQAIEAQRWLQRSGYNLNISVNISAKNLRETDFPDMLRRLLAAAQLSSDKLTLELTETSLMEDPIVSLRVLRNLDRLKVPLAIDDFGSGYSSLSYLKQIPAKKIKIDRSLITDIAHHADDRIIVQTTINMCRSLGYDVVAEGVEDGTTLDLLRTLGCTQAQGYHIARPMPLDDVLRWLRQRHALEQASGGRS